MCLADGGDWVFLKSLTLRGFKSFASTTVLNFEPGITCVVGPNGSGKSNVVDALTWVMGEQGVKTLRGGKMEDVIFAGTPGRAPLGRAQVSLTIDNTDGALPIEYTEVTISRTMFRSGGSEYSINGSPSRLLDIQELLSDSGIGREMHVIVGQGQLDAILHATPEVRRGFIEEAAGVLKHRKRKEKAVRKLEATRANLDRLADLLIEIRRQLKPLGRQAEVARRAAVIQAELRDAKARLLADDYVMATLSLESELAAEAALKQQRVDIESALERARAEEAKAEQQVSQIAPQLARCQETWYALAGLRERLRSTLTIAGERVRHAQASSTDDFRGRDPDAIDAEAAQVEAQHDAMASAVEGRADALQDASAAKVAAEQAHQAAESHYAAQVRAIADRREGLARLTGEVKSLRSRVEAGDAEIGRLEGTRDAARTRAAAAQRRYASLETQLGGLTEGESGLDAAYEQAEDARQEALAVVERVRGELQAAQQERAAASARLEGLRLGLDRKDGSAAVLAASEQLGGVLGSVAALVEIEPGFEAAVASALGGAAEAVAVRDVSSAIEVFGHLRGDDLGRVGLLLAGVVDVKDRGSWPKLLDGARYVVDVVTTEPELQGSVARLLRKVAVVDDLSAAQELVEDLPDITAVTRSGDVLSAWWSAGGSSAKASLIEVQAAVDDAARRLDLAQRSLERLSFEQTAAEVRLAEANEQTQRTLAALHESDARFSAFTEELGQLNQTSKAALAEADRLTQAIGRAEESRAGNFAALAELETRLARASEASEIVEADPAHRDESARQAAKARQTEMEARLGLRTLQERARALAGQAQSLRQRAAAERAAREQAAIRQAQLKRQAEVSAAIGQAAQWLLARVDESQASAGRERTVVDTQRIAAERQVSDARQRSRDLAREFESLIDVVHKDELARAEQRLRIENLSERALTELGLGADELVAEFGPDQLVPVITRADGSALADDDVPPEPIPYDRAVTERRLRSAERNLAILGRVNPLALEEFDALSERHTFLAEQLDDLKRTRSDLMDIIAEVDSRVEQVFAAAYADVEREFQGTFARLFPGGEGRLVLTEPGSWLTTGVEVEARPAGKKVKRLSLLSGGERSLVAVAFLVALFRARPSPFYILDEVEAALDDVNLGRLLQIYEELRQQSQMIVITHQKRTMEIADALYGVTMRDSGISTVISQRLREI